MSHCTRGHTWRGEAAFWNFLISLCRWCSNKKAGKQISTGSHTHTASCKHNKSLLCLHTYLLLNPLAIESSKPLCRIAFLQLVGYILPAFWCNIEQCHLVNPAWGKGALNINYAYLFPCLWEDKYVNDKCSALSPTDTHTHIYKLVFSYNYICILRKHC